MKFFCKTQWALTLVISLFLPIQLAAWTGEVIREMEVPGRVPTGLTFDGDQLWIADRDAQLIYRIDRRNGKVLKTIESPGYWPMGLAWDGSSLWNADVKGGIALTENYQGKIYQLNPENGHVLHAVSAPCNAPRGLCWDGTYLWCVDDMSDQLIQFSAQDGTTIKTFAAPSGNSQGLSFDGSYLWVSDRVNDELYMVDPNTGWVLLITQAPGAHTRGLAFDGIHLWANDYHYKKVYQLKIRDGELLHKYNARTGQMIYTHQVQNYGPGKLLSADIHIAVPKNRVNQELLGAITCQPLPTDRVVDHWGQQTLHYQYSNLLAGEKRQARMIVRSKNWDVRYFIYPEQVGTLDLIPDSISAIYLADNEKYQIKHPVIQNAVKAATGSATNPYWKTRRIYNYLIDHMYYEMVGGWNTAPTVLSRGNGSCSEYAFVFIAMCRAAGIPARYVGSVVVIGDETSMDDVHHRWVEVYLPNYGWIPVDPSGGDSSNPRTQAQSIGFIANRYLITTQSGGGSETMGWTYNSKDSYTSEPKTHVVFDHFGEWEPLP